MKKMKNAFENLLISSKAYNTKLAWQWAEGVKRSGWISDVPFSWKRGHVFEVMDSQNPLNSFQLCEAANQEAIDAVSRNGDFVQYKASNKSHVQNEALAKMEKYRADNGLNDTDHNDTVRVLKGNKSSDDPRVIESPVSEQRLRDASEAVAWADSSLGLMLKAGMTAAAISGVMETAIQAYKLYKKAEAGETITTADFWEASKAIASEAGYGAFTGVCVAAFSLVATAAVLPELVVLGGSVVVGFVVNTLARKLVKVVRKQKARL